MLAIYAIIYKYLISKFKMFLIIKMYVYLNKFFKFKIHCISFFFIFVYARQQWHEYFVSRKNVIQVSLHRNSEAKYLIFKYTYEYLFIVYDMKNALNTL